MCGETHLDVWKFFLVPGPGRKTSRGAESEALGLGLRKRKSHCLSFPSSRAQTPGWPGCTCVAWPRLQSREGRCTCTSPRCWCTFRSGTGAPCRWCLRTRWCLQENGETTGDEVKLLLLLPPQERLPSYFKHFFQDFEIEARFRWVNIGTILKPSSDDLL